MIGVFIFFLALYVSREKQSWGIFRWIFIASSFFVAIADFFQIDYYIDSKLLMVVWIAALICMLRGFYAFIQEL